MIPETYAPVLLRNRANTLSKVTGKVYRSKFEEENKVELGQLFKDCAGSTLGLIVQGADRLPLLAVSCDHLPHLIR